MQKVIQFKTKGMQRDLSASAFNSEYAYENKNVRVMPTDESTLLSLINEKGNKKSSISGIGEYIKGIPIGQALVNNELIIFTAGDDDYRLADITPNIFEAPDIFICDNFIDNLTAEEDTANDITPNLDSIKDITFTDCIYELNIDVDSMLDDRIYKLWFNNGALTGKRLFRGNLEFNYKHPIETISFYENTDIRKVYWTDGLNQPRVINVAATSDVVSKWNTDSFNFVQRLKLNESVSIERNIVSSGNFAPGVIQYAFTYFNKYGQESNIFYTSPLYYISYNNRGASPEDRVSNSFNIEVTNVDKRFDYIRVYSIHRTSINATPDVRRVVDLAPPTGRSSYKLSSYKINLPANKMTMYRRGIGAEKTLDQYEPFDSGPGYKAWEFETSEYDGINFGGDYLTWGTGKFFVITITNDNRASMQLHDDSNMTGILSIAKVNYTDNGLSGDSVDPTELLYIGGEEVVFGTMAQKDNTLFLGDITLKKRTLSSVIRSYFKGKSITFKLGKKIEAPDYTGYYPYSNQLKMNSYQFKTFKYLEYYRFGIQAQHYTGKWSEPIWINDVKNTIPIKTIFYKKSDIELPIAQYILDSQYIINKFIEQGYVRIRPVVVYPSIYDREAVCQGILCPTVFNVSDRYNNTPFAQSSWFIRPNAPFDIVKSSWDWKALYDRTVPLSKYSRAGILANYYSDIGIDGETYIHDPINNGVRLEFRHHIAIPSNSKRDGEIQCIYNPPLRPYVSSNTSDSDITEWVSSNSENFYIDQSILTFHSPDIEFDDKVRSIDTSELKLRIVGMVPLTSFVGDIDIQTSTPVNNFKGSEELPIGFYKEPIGATSSSLLSSGGGDSCFGYRALAGGAFWFDDYSNYHSDKGNSLKQSIGFFVYPWHRNGSLNNTKYNVDDAPGYKSAMLDKKKISNMRFSYQSVYMDPSCIWNAYEEGNTFKTGISGVSIFDSNEVSVVRVPAQLYSGFEDINYYGNVDKLLTWPRSGTKKDGYPIINTIHFDNIVTSHLIFASNTVGADSDYTWATTGFDPVRMRYKSTPHAVLALNYTEDGRQKILPTIYDYDSPDSEHWPINQISGDGGDNTKTFWDKRKTHPGIHIEQDVIETGIKGPIPNMGGIQHGWLWLGELYNDNVKNRFGGQTEEAFENNVWLPCGDPVSLVDNLDGVKDSITIKWTEGDTYYQRYDHIKTYPFTLEDQNAMTEIVSFMCETRVNIDGRYDRNRGKISNFSTTPENFNLVNDVYSQPNNFFNYRTINPNKLNLDTFHNSITWTKTKTAGELVDTWTNITFASTLDLDGDKGTVRALKRLNNNILAFQDRGISQILYNENMQISSTDGVPIEIANSGKVNGKRYISDRIGCTNKWSMCETSNGIYFIDDITKGIFLFNGQLNNISDKLGFHSWINRASDSIDTWNPVDFDGFVTYYDKVNGDVFFINKDECLAFSEPLGQFSSFYSYEKMPYFINLEDRGIAFNTKDGGTLYRPWLHNEGDYNMYFDKYQPFYTTVIANPDMPVDKIFNNLEFRSDSWNKNGNLLNTTFDTLTVWNEYQQGTSTLNNILGRPSDLKKKFRIWRANIPRAKANGRDRMRNPWLYIKLSMEGENVNKTVLHDMIVHYFE